MSINIGLIVIQDYLQQRVGQDPDAKVFMSPEQQLVCARGRAAVYRLKVQATYQWLDCESIPSAACENADRCASFRDNLVGEILHPLNKREVLGKWQVRWSGMLCAECEAIAKHNYARERQGLWDALPGLFELACWDDLRDEQRQNVSWKGSKRER